MSKFELSLAKDYVPDWNYVDAVREIFQNALDQEATVEGNDMFFNYNPDTQILSIGNKLSTLETSTLLLGSSTKRNDDNTIGQFGEGYKIATLVLTREDKKVTFYNYGNREVWKPRFVNSRRYGAEILTFFVDKKYPWQSVPDNNLVITIENITLEEYENIVESNLHLQDIGEHFATGSGRILLDEKYKGKVYVNGLYVCNYNSYHYGYDFKPRLLKIDRDRRLVDNFELKWLASNMWLDDGDEEMRRIAADLIKQDAADVQFFYNLGHSNPHYTKTANYAHDDFKKEYGDKAIPVSSQEEMEAVSKTTYRPVMVSESRKESITSSTYYSEPDVLYVPTIEERLNNWLDDHKQSLSKRAINELESIIDDL